VETFAQSRLNSAENYDQKIATCSVDLLEKFFKQNLQQEDTYERVISKCELQAHQVLQDIREKHGKQAYKETLSLIKTDERRQTYPYLTLIFLFRAGFHDFAVRYCASQDAKKLQDVIDFGANLYSVYRKNNGRLTPAQADSYTHNSKYDICRDVMVSLMTGRKFSSPFEDQFFSLMGGETVAAKLWVNLKLASMADKAPPSDRLFINTR
jgi:hypothetical protein